MTIPPDIRSALAALARAAHPDECCGYLTGPAERPDTIVACTNVAGDPTTTYAIDGRELFDLARSFAGPSPARVIYHSHPNGRAYFSPTDRALALAADYPVAHLVIGDGAQALFTRRGDDFVEVARWDHAA